MAEIVGCPSCQRQLQIPEQFLGQAVQCPECQHQFTAAVAPISARPMSVASERSDPPRPRRREYDDDEPYGRRRRYDDDEDDDDFDLRRSRRYHVPHRGNTVLALGLLSLVGGISLGLPALLGPVAWVMGYQDLSQIRDGHMDPTGESMTRSGMWCGAIATVGLIGCGSCVLLSIFGRLA